MNKITTKLTQQVPVKKLILPKGSAPFAKNHKHSLFLNTELQKIQKMPGFPGSFAENH
jgi:hypothetical protein